MADADGAHAVDPTDGDVLVTWKGARFHIPHPPGGHASQTLSAAAAHLEKVGEELSNAPVGADGIGGHAVHSLLAKAWTSP